MSLNKSTFGSTFGKSGAKLLLKKRAKSLLKKASKIAFKKSEQKTLQRLSGSSCLRFGSTFSKG